MSCTYCGGAGVVEVDVGQVYECVPCQNAKPLDITKPLAAADLIKKSVKLVATISASDFVGVISEVNGIGWNDACEVVSNNEIYGQDGAGSYTIYRDPEENGELTPYAKRAIAAIFLVHRNHDSISIVED